MRSRLRTIGRRDFPSWKPSSWTRITNSRDGTIEGIPTKETLQELDLDYVAEDLEQRGIIKNGQS